MEEINLLLLEDNDSTIESFGMTADKFKREGKATFKIINYKSFNKKRLEIFSDILENKIDFIVVDLRLENGESEGGNSFLNTIYNNFHIPIIINSSNLLELNENFNQDNNPLIKQFSPESNSINNIFDYILNIVSTGITNVVGKNGLISNTLNNLIWNGGLNNIQEWCNYSDKKKSTMSLGRYVIAHLYNELGESSKDFHPEECYIKNHNSRIITGTILKRENSYYVIMNPACDLAQGNMDYYILCEIDEFNEKENKRYDNLKGLYKKLEDEADEKEQERIHKKIRNEITSVKKDNSKVLKFIPKSTYFKSGGYINFRKISIVREGIENYSIICNITVDFLKDIIPDFGNYYSRQGQPDLDHSI